VSETLGTQIYPFIAQSYLKTLIQMINIAFCCDENILILVFLLFTTGPMVYGTCYSPISKKEDLKALGFAGMLVL